MENDAILFWNRVCQQAHANDHTGTPPPQEQGGPAFASRAFAIVHAAMYDAANSFYRTRRPYAISGRGREGTDITSVESAIAGAAFTTLLDLYKKQKEYFEERLEVFVQLLKETAPLGKPLTNEIFKINFELGRKVGDQITALRKNDGSDASRVRSPLAKFPNASEEVLSRPNPGTGIPDPSTIRPEHQPDPENPDQGLYAPRWGVVIPFVIKDLTTVIQSANYPALNSEKYLLHFNEVKNIGFSNSTTRTAEQLQIGIYWAYDGTQKLGTPIRLYNQIAQNVSTNFNFSQEENARYFLLINLAMADAGIHTWFAKYKHNLWRPIVGIRKQSTINNLPWTPFGSPNSNSPGLKNFTPPFPAYPSGHATFGTAIFTVIDKFLNERFKRNQMAVDPFPIKRMVSDEYNGVTIDNLTKKPRPLLERTFSISSAISENLESRIFLGVHWRFDGDEGERVGKEIGERVFQQVANEYSGK